LQQGWTPAFAVVDVNWTTSSFPANKQWDYAFYVADALGARVIPGVRERQSHPRFMTTMAIGARVCASFAEDRVAGDGVSPSWHVYEWLAVEGFGQSAESSNDYTGLPRPRKAQARVAWGLRLSAQRYLNRATDRRSCCARERFGDRGEMPSPARDRSRRFPPSAEPVFVPCRRDGIAAAEVHSTAEVDLLS